MIDRIGWAIAGALAIALIGVLAGLTEAGPLNPPGSPASTDGVRLPGTPISSLPFTINVQGSYYLTRNLTGGVGQNGITIAASNVTLDLNGFTLTGVPGSNDGITTTSSVTRVTIKNGQVVNWGVEGIDLFFATRSQVSDVSIGQNGGVGVKLGNLGILRDCTLDNNLLAGAFVENAIVTECNVTNNADGIQATFSSRITDNVIAYNNHGANAAGVRLFGGLNTVQDNAINHNDLGVVLEAGNNLVINNYIFNPVGINMVLNGHDVLRGPFAREESHLGPGASPYSNISPLD